ncbi:MAG: hypothetical protein DHS80DRAFT_26301 [Piptocephalis tieghemiana]|nr:MAG: hypothetical protein DHS80DRAFT_26301 [Piptocephalis tieghemiana]
MRPSLRPSASYPRLNAGSRVGKSVCSMHILPQTLTRRYHHLQSALDESRAVADTLRRELSNEAMCLQESLSQLAPVMSEQEERLRELQWRLELTERDKQALTRKVQVAEDHLKKTVVELEVAREEAEEARRRGSLAHSQGLPFEMGSFSAFPKESFIPPLRTSSIPQGQSVPGYPIEHLSLPPNPLRGFLKDEDEGDEACRNKEAEGKVITNPQCESGEDDEMDMEDLDEVDHWVGLDSDVDDYDEEYDEYEEEDFEQRQEMDRYTDYSVVAPPVATF